MDKFINDGMNDQVTEGDLVIMQDINWDNTKRIGDPYKAIVLWRGLNNQPLITKFGEYNPCWSTYESIVEVVGHLDLQQAISESCSYLYKREFDNEDFRGFEDER